MKKRAAPFAVGLLAAGAALSQTLPQVTISATRSEASPFDVPASVDPRGRFTGKFDAERLTGTFAGSHERIDLKRGSSYWDRSH